VKRVLKGVEPPKLIVYRQAKPQSTWEEMRDDALNNGQQAYQDCRSTVISDQMGLCAFCEIDIRDNAPFKCHVEHFHAKSDREDPHNWALDWNNMIGVCNGGSNKHVQAGGFYLEPRKENLSCDAHKDLKIQKHELPEQCEGWILNPLQIAMFPCLFQLEKSSGKFLPNSSTCAAVNIPDNQHQTTEQLIAHTIKMLNLNCDRLASERRKVIFDIERNKKQQRQAGYNAEQGLSNLVGRYFRTQWPGFFTTIRLCLGDAAEAHLKSIQFKG